MYAFEKCINSFHKKFLSRVFQYNLQPILLFNKSFVKRVPIYQMTYIFLLPFVIFSKLAKFGTKFLVYG